MNVSKYSLTIRNQSSQFRKFAIFQTFRDTTESAVKPLPLAWIVGAAAPGYGEQSSNSEFTWRTTYNVLIVKSYHMGDDMFQTNSIEMPISPDGENGYAVTYFGDFPLGAPAFVGSIVDREKGYLLIQSGHRIPAVERQYEENCFLKVGFSMAGKQASVADLLPDNFYKFALDPVYRITLGEFYPGQVLGDFSVSKSYVIDFGTATKKTIVLGADDTFSEEK